MSHVRFEPWLVVPEELAERRRRLLMGAMSAALLSMAMGLTSWTADKLGISRVAPPKHTYAVTLQLLEPPPPPPAPPPPVGAIVETNAQKDEAPHDDPAPSEPDEIPTEVVTLDLDARPRAQIPVPSGREGGGGSPSGSPTGVPNGIGSKCLLPPCIGTQQTIGRPVLPQPKPASDPVQEPIERVMASSIFTPDPDQDRLSRTPTGRTHRRAGKTTVAFCIDGNGKTYDVRVRRRFPGDAEVDEICRTTVSKWRFSPQRVGGKARSTCSSVTFDIRFE